MTLTEFLLARIAEDEVAARAAIDPARPGTHWEWVVPDDEGDPDAPRWLRTVEDFPTTSGVGPLPAFPLGSEFKAEPSRGMDHIARHDPARVLAQCKADRQLLELHGDNGSIPGKYELRCYACESDYPCDTLKIMALPYAGHPDYHPGWRS